MTRRNRERAAQPIHGTHRLALGFTVAGFLLSISLGSLFLFGPVFSPAVNTWAEQHLVLFFGALVLVLVAFPLVYALTPWFADRWVLSDEEIRFIHRSPKGSSARVLSNSGFVRLRSFGPWTTATREDGSTLRLPRSLQTDRGGRQVLLQFTLVEDRLSLVESREPV